MATPLDKISASGRVVRVAPTFMYIHSEQYGSVFAYPAAYFNNSENTPLPTNQKLTEVLRVDDVVHFAAIPQNGPNDCHWIAIKVTKRLKQPPTKLFTHTPEPSPIASTDQETPEIIRNAVGMIMDLHDRNGFIYSEKYGKIYFPMAAAEIVLESNEVFPLNILYEDGAWVMFDAQRQPYKNDCRYVATRVRNTHPDNIGEEEESVTATSTPMRDVKLKKEKAIGSSKHLVGQQGSFPADVNYQEGDIVRLFPQYGFIRSETLGTVYFTLAHYECGGQVASLLADLSIGDRVRFLPMPQPEKNGCHWRGLKVEKVDLDFITPLAELLEKDSGNHVSCEVSVQTDQSLWNAFLAAQTTAPRRRERHPVPTQDTACQTTISPEMLLMKAVKEDAEFQKTMKERFPYLMRYIEKNT